MFVSTQKTEELIRNLWISLWFPFSVFGASIDGFLYKTDTFGFTFPFQLSHYW